MLISAEREAHWPGAAASDVAIETKQNRLLPVQWSGKLGRGSALTRPLPLVVALNPALLIKFKTVLKAHPRTEVAVGVKAQPVDQRIRVLVPVLLEIHYRSQTAGVASANPTLSLL